MGKEAILSGDVGSIWTDLAHFGHELFLKGREAKIDLGMEPNRSRVPLNRAAGFNGTQIN
ncbi:hypothetical protein SLEP1_g29310 [Rubroshorea leprosula]|uniref:Uncharacterized protein n=1 Tax=Rubroshorea leprosula TaxID=152421 RepID=A0AAV5K3K1_9ROSI|nr:hypothetical protein SLEP1_g29310 [Rubroshorea leprosula]